MSREESEIAITTPDSSTFSPPHETQDETATEPEYNKEVLMKKLQDMPLETLKSIITNQIDLEIRLKHKELALTDEEIGKCESQMVTLRKYFKIPSNVNFDSEPNGFTHKYSNLLSQALNFNYEHMSKLASLADSGIPGSAGSNVGETGGRISYSRSSSIPSAGSSEYGSIGGEFGSGEGLDGQFPTHSYRTRSTTSSLRPSSSTRKMTYGCLYRRTDGIIVKLTCPNCLRSNFSSAQGFLNHSRIAHSKEYTSQDAAALQCGEILPDDEQDEEGILSLQNLKVKGLDPKKNLNVNEIYFNGLSSGLNSQREGDRGGFDEQRASQSQNQVQQQQQHQQQSQQQQQIQQSISQHNQLQQQYELQQQSQESQSQQQIRKAQPPPRRKSNDLLMKKLIEKGITSNKTEYDKLIHDTMSEVKNSHLFNGEEESEEFSGKEGNTSTSSITQLEEESRKDKNRRKSRGGVGISKPGSYSAKNNKDSSTSTSTSGGSGLPKLKLKLKRSSET